MKFPPPTGPAPVSGHDHVKVFVGVHPDSVTGAVQFAAPLSQELAVQSKDADETTIVFGNINHIIVVYAEKRRAD